MRSQNLIFFLNLLIIKVKTFLRQMHSKVIGQYVMYLNWEMTSDSTTFIKRSTEGWWFGFSLRNLTIYVNKFSNIWYMPKKFLKIAPYFFVNAGIRRASPFNVNQGFCPAILLTFLLVFFTSKIYYDYIVIYHDYFIKKCNWLESRDIVHRRSWSIPIWSFVRNLGI